MAIVAVMMMVGFSAFKVVETLNDDPILETWYFIGEENEETDASQYSLEQDPENECGLPVTICEILAPLDPSTNLPKMDHIVDPNDQHIPQRTVEYYILEAMANPGTPNVVVKDFRDF